MVTNAESVAAWRALAIWWDDHIGPTGSAFHRRVVAPAAEALLDAHAGDNVLDVACGNGQFARRLAARGVRVVAFDAVEEFIARARAHTPEGAAIEYHVIDATDEEGVAALGAARFDAAVANMALMDIADLAPLFRGLARALRPGGRFVATLRHPCFGPGGSRLARLGARLPRRARHALLALDAAAHLARYLRSDARAGTGAPGQPIEHFAFHRPLSALLAPAFAAGFVLDGLDEPPALGARERPGLLALRLRLDGPARAP